MSAGTKTETVAILFTDGEREVARWPGYASYEDARRAIADADQIIPFHWNWTIVGPC